MRLDAENFITANTSSSKKPRYVVEISFDDANTDLYYITSHDDSALPSGALSIDGIIEDISGTTQKITPEKGLASIGTLVFNVVDLADSVTTLQYDKLQLGKGLRGKRVRVYVGYVGNIWSEYSLVTTQVIETVVYRNGKYIFNCSDVQRLERNILFDLAFTNLSSTLNVGDTVVNVYNTTDFIALEHGTSYSDAPSQTVYYFKIDDEVIRATGKTGSTFTGCERGALNTKEVEHVIDTDAIADRRTKVEEYVYLELPAPKLIYAILTGKLIGQSTELPPSWHLGISESFVRQSDFTGVGKDLFDTVYDTNGLVLPFHGLKKQDGKKFIEKELLLLMGCFTPVYGTGELGLLRMVSVLSNSGFIATLDEENIVSYSDLIHDMKSLHNNIEIKWNWLDSKEKFTRKNILIDQDSISTHGLATQLEFKFRGLYGNRHTAETLAERFNSFRDRYTGPPLRINVTCLPSTNIYEVGDTIRLKLDNIKDYNTGQALDRTFEIQNVSIDWITGRVSFALFGSSQKAGAISATAATTVIPDTWYTSEGVNLATHVETSYDYSTDYENISGIGHIKSSSSITGGADLTNGSGVLGTNSIYYHDGDLIIDFGVTLNISDNIQLRVKGFLTINGDINGEAFGLLGGADRKDLDKIDPRAGYADHSNKYIHNVGQSGFIGPTRSMGGELGDSNSKAIAPAEAGWFLPTPENVTDGLHSTAPSLSLNYANSQLNGIPQDLRGTSGASGGNWCARIFSLPNGDTFYHLGGGKGGNSGAGLMIVSRGAGFGASGKINLSGEAPDRGSLHPGGSYSLAWANATQSRTVQKQYGGTGAPGAPGALYFAIDGKYQTFPDLTNTIFSDYGDMPFNPDNGRVPAHISWSEISKPYIAAPPQYPHLLGLDGKNVDLTGNNGATRILFVTGAEIAVEDSQDATNTASAISLIEYTNLPLSAAGNLSSIEVTVTPPSDANYDYSNVYYKVDTQDVWTLIGSANDKVVIVVASDGLTYDFEARGVSISNIENLNGISSQITTTDVTTPELNTDIAVIETLVVPDVSGLELFEGGNTEEFTGKDAKFTWNKSSITNSYFIGSEPTGVGSNTGALDLYFRDYEVRIYNDSETLLRIENVVDNVYTYTHEKNVEDYERVVGTVGANRSFRIEVFARSRQGQLSINAARLPVSNPAPVLPTSINLKANFRALFLEYILPTDLDFAGVKIWIDTSTGFTRDNTTLVYNGVGSNVIIDVLGDGSALQPNTTYYVYMLAYDAFGETGTESVELSTTTLYVETSDIKPLAVTDALILNLSAGKILADVISASLVFANAMVLTTLGVVRSAATFGAAGIWLGWDTTAYKFYVGDGDKKFLQYDGSDVLIGAETKITGSFSYDSDALYYQTYFDSIDGWSKADSGTGSLVSVATGLSIAAGSDPASYAYAQKIMGNPIAGISYANDMRFKTKLIYGGGNVSSPYFNGWVACGGYFKSNGGVRSGDGVGIEMRNTSSMFFFVHNSTGSHYEIDVTSVFGITGNGGFLIEFIFDMVNEEAYLYVDTVLKATIIKATAGAAWPTATTENIICGMMLNGETSYSKHFSFDEVRMIAEN